MAIINACEYHNRALYRFLVHRAQLEVTDGQLISLTRKLTIISMIIIRAYLLDSAYIHSPCKICINIVNIIHLPHPPLFSSIRALFVLGR